VSAAARLAALERGDTEPSRALLVKMAKHYRRSLLTFYLHKAPAKGERGQDFRTLPADARSASSGALLDALVRDLTVRQQLVRAILEDEEETKPLEFVGSAKLTDGIGAVLASIKRVVDLPLDAFRAANSADQAFSILRRKVEGAGVFVLLAGNLGSHHSAIEVEVFRGFAIADKIAPFIVINDQDSPSAWTFTLLHELAHIWLGATGVSGGRVAADLPIERFCNEVAAAFLLPADDLANLDIGSAAFDETKRRITLFAEARNLSSSMVAYRLQLAGRISLQDWQRLSASFREDWQNSRTTRRERQRGQDGGPNYYVVRKHRLGDALVRLVRRHVREGDLSPTRAARILGVKARGVETLISVGAS